MCLSVEEGEIVCLLGSNGAGKSTTLLTVLGILRPLAGDVVFCGRRLNGLKTAEIIKLGIAVVPEGRRIFGPLTVEENLRIGGAVRRGPARDTLATLEMVLETFPILRERGKQLAGTLSGGQQQMLAIGRALMTKPRLLLMDEPSMGLSPLMSEQIFEVIERIGRQGMAVLLVEQNAHAALSVAARGYVLQTGRIVLEGKASLLRDAEVVKAAYL